MKKVIFMFSGIILSLSLASARGEQKPDVRYTPEAGEFSIGFDATPIFNYIGNLFNGSAGNEFEGLAGKPFTSGLYDSNILPDVSIMAKYMVTDNFAVRANLGVMVVGNNSRYYVTDDAAIANDPLSEAKVIDRMKYSRSGVSLSVGGEYRVGKKRVQGVFGGGLLFALQSNSYKYSYGNAITEINQRPSTTNEFGQEVWNGNYRVLKTNTDGVNTYLGLTVSAGVEWFVAPKISLGAEVNLSAYYMFGTKAFAQSEGYSAALAKVETRTDLISPGNRMFCLGTESLGGALSISFWF